MSSPLPAGPRAPAFVQMARKLSHPYAYAERMRARYGDAYTERVPGMPPSVVISDPEGVRYLTTAGYDELDRVADGLRFMLGDQALIFLQDAPHKQTRKLLQPPLHGERMRAYGADMAAITDDVLGRFGDGELRLLVPEMQGVALRIILRTVFGITDARRSARLEALFIGYLNEIMTPWFYGAQLLLSGARVRDFLRARGERIRRAPPSDAPPSRWPVQSVADRLGAIDAILFDEIARCRRLTPEERSQRTDILAMMIDARYEDGSPMSDDVLRDNLMILLIGGHETTATTISWAIHCALANPGTLEHMRAEVDSVFHGQFDPTRVKQLNYVGAVVSESMRLYPIALGVARRLRHEKRIAGHLLPAGTVVVPSMYLAQRDPRLWEQPNAFLPERFLSGKASVYEFFPFGAGVWRCLGAQFAEYEMRVVLARMVAQMDFFAEPGMRIHPVQRGFTVAPSHSMPVRVRRRHSLARKAA
jgi:cytochrome P450